MTAERINVLLIQPNPGSSVFDRPLYRCGFQTASDGFALIYRTEEPIDTGSRHSSQSRTNTTVLCNVKAIRLATTDQNTKGSVLAGFEAIVTEGHKF